MITNLNIRNCVRCNKIFMPVGGDKICPDCRAADLKTEEYVKTYVRDHPGIMINDLIEQTGVPSKFIWRMVQRGQFEHSGLRGAEYPCSNCGKMIKHGIYCEMCADKLKTNAQKFAAAMNSKQRVAESNKAHAASGKTFSNSMYDALSSAREN
ncbi:MAG: hypothetical protein K6G55_03680 [Selenomonadaceae bacterium]|nr:hypothetical protein [Selenomonadaceae bacterium]